MLPRLFSQPYTASSTAATADESAEALEGFRADNVAICVEDLKLQLLAKSCFVPGLPNLLFNLIMSSSETDVSVFWRRVLNPGAVVGCYQHSH